jgi:hypothetical protein
LPAAGERVQDGLGSRRAERVLVVSLMKSGTHLIQELLVALGYGIYGQSRIPLELRPVLDEETRLRVARLVYADDLLAEFETREEPLFTEATDRAWEALGWAWQIRFGLPLENRYGFEVTNAELIEQAQRRSASSDFADTPSGVCWVLPELDVKRLDGRFIREWSRTGEPRIVFNYRDPRDVLLSMVNFLAGRTRQGLGTFSEFQVFGRILDSKPSLGEQLSYALTDPSFPGSGDFERALWLLHHPNVCKVSFEELVGPEGGGLAEAQTRAVARILDFVGADVDPEGLARRLYRRDAFSFYRGQIGGWRDVFTTEHLTLFERRFGDVLRLYGYE